MNSAPLVRLFRHYLTAQLVCYYLLANPVPASAEPLPQMGILKPIPARQIKQRLKHIIGDGDRVTVTEVTQAILTLIVDDLKVQRLDYISPLAIRAIVPRPPLSSPLSDWAETRLIAILHQESSIEIRECISCKRQQTSIEGSDLVFRQGNTQKGNVANPKDDSSVQSFLEVSLSWDADRQVLTSIARLYNKADQVIWSESYRSGDEGALAKRGLKDLNVETSIGTYQRLATPPKTKTLDLHELILGMGVRQGQGTVRGLGRLGYGYGLFFGREAEYLLTFRGIISLSQQHIFTDLLTQFNIRISDPIPPPRQSKVKERAFYANRGLWLSGIFGVPFSPLISGTLVGGGLHYMSQYKIGLGFTMAYAFNFDHQVGADPGGFSSDINLLINF